MYIHPYAAKYVAGKVCSVLVTPECPKVVIDELAQLLLDTGYDFHELLEVLLNSSLMFAPETKKIGVRSPIEMQVALTRVTGFRDFLSNNADFDILRGKGANPGLEDMGQLPFLPDTIFGWAGRGVNRDQLTNYGETWFSAQLLLSRQQNIAQLINQVGDNGFNWDGLLPSLDPKLTEGKVISHFEKMFNISLSDAEKQVVVNFLNDPSPWSEVIVDEKLRDNYLAGLVEIFAVHPQFSMQ